MNYFTGKLGMEERGQKQAGENRLRTARPRMMQLGFLLCKAACFLCPEMYLKSTFLQ